MAIIWLGNSKHRRKGFDPLKFFFISLACYWRESNVFNRPNCLVGLTLVFFTQANKFLHSIIGRQNFRLKDFDNFL